MIYLLDSNVITDFSRNVPMVVTNLNQKLRQGHSLTLSSPVYYESLRGLIKVNATAQIARLSAIKELLDWEAVSEADWLQAAQFWANTVTVGKQLSDMDLLIAALAARLNAILVSADADFDALPINREDWRVIAS
ncbi:MAG: PIN domain-containing protein [Anaerolineaceae bacterium]|nr:PIN domain-containing protein [Anaerolineaceae bacterium]